MKLKKKEKNEIKEKKRKAINFKGIHLRRKAKEDLIIPEESRGFAARVNSSDPIFRLKDVKKQSVWTKDLVPNCLCAALLTAAIAMFCMCTGSPVLVLFALTCPLVFMAIATTGSVKPGMLRWIVAGFIAVVLLATAILWRSQIFGGLSMLINRFYDAAEEAQAYLYDRLAGGDYATEGAGMAAMAWVSGLIGLIAALPPAKLRRMTSVLIAIASMLLFAYYGMIPHAACIAVMIAALIAAVSRGSITAFLPVMLSALLLFGAIVLVNPGEFYGVSRVNENLRDRFALHSGLLESDESMYEEEEESYEEEEEYEEGDFEEEGDFSEYSSYVLYGIIGAVAAVLCAAAFIFFRRVSKKRAQNRKGIKSKDAREAVTALFPYAVRWLKGYGIKQSDASFSSMEPDLVTEFSDSYAKLFSEMYVLWSEAAYSEHDVTEKNRLLMEAFTEDTITQVKKKAGFFKKLKLRLGYAL